MFLIVNQESVQVSDMELSMELMQNLVGIEGESSVYDFITNKFSDPTITMIIDDNYLGNPSCKPSCVIPNTRELIHGQVLIVADDILGDFFIGLNDAQIEIVKNELLVLIDNRDSYLAYKAKNFFPEH